MLADFRKELLTCCQLEFEKDHSSELQRVKEIAAEKKKILTMPETLVDQKAVQDLAEEEDRLGKSKRRRLGCMQFVGELFNIGLVYFNFCVLLFMFMLSCCFDQDPTAAHIHLCMHIDL